jgi:CRP-like cAMP-binding protein
LFKQGEQGDAAYIIIDGSVDVVVNSPSGSAVVATLELNQIVGEIAIVCDVPRTATVRATGELAALRITKELFFKLSIEFPHLALEVLKEIGGRLEETTGRLSEAMVAG